MHYRVLGRTGLRVSLLGLGSGGASQLGQSYEMPASESQRLVRHALDAGVNLIDTAPGYGRSQELLGEALVGVPRDQYILCTKFSPTERDGQLKSSAALRLSLEDSLRKLRTDVIEVLYLHGVGDREYETIRDRFLPELIRARDDGLIRYIGVSEQYQSDHAHNMLVRAIPEGALDVVMVGFNVMSPAAVTSVLPVAAQHNVGVTVMCAVRSVLVKPEAVKQYIETWQREGLLQPGLVEPDAALDWLLDEQTPNVASAAYKFAAAFPAVSSVLTGTASLAHFQSNLDAVVGPPFPVEKVQRVIDVFGPVQRNVQPPRRKRAA